MKFTFFQLKNNPKTYGKAKKTAVVEISKNRAENTGTLFELHSLRRPSSSLIFLENNERQIFLENLFP